MADLSSFRSFVETVNAYFTVNVSYLLSKGLPKRIDIDSWELGKDSFDGPTDRFDAAWYALYRRRCRAKGVEPGPFAKPSEDD